MKRLLRNFLTLAIAATFMAAPSRARAESGASDIPPPADTKPIYPPPPVQPEEDRNKGNGAAIAAALIGAAMAGASCAMLMKQAQQARASGDTQQANQLMMMAMQQCAQAAQNAANAAQNSENGKKINQSDPGQPKWADLPQGEAAKKAESKTAQSSPASSEEQPAEETVNPAEFKGLDDRAFAAAPGTEPGPGGDTMGDGSLGNGIVKLDPIDSTSVQFDDKSKGGGTTPQTPLGTSSSLVAGGGSASTSAKFQGDDRIDTGAVDGKAPNARSSRITGASPGSLGGGSSSSDHSSSGGFDMAGLMEKLGGAKSDAGGGSMPPDIQAFKRTVDGTNVSIFQYASFRYRKAQRDDGLITDPRKKLAAGDSNLTATPARAPASKPAPQPPAKPGKGIGDQKPLKKATVASRR